MFSAFLRKKSLHDVQIVVVWKAEREKSLLEGRKAAEAAVCLWVVLWHHPVAESSIVTNAQK